MTSQRTAYGRFTRAIAARNLLNAETAARELGTVNIAEALAVALLMAERSRSGGRARLRAGTRVSCSRRRGSDSTRQRSPSKRCGRSRG
jgi:hypothetical protein